MKQRKRSGSYYTPKLISDFMAEYLSDKLMDSALTVFEPSAGDGRFVDSICNHPLFKDRITSFIAVEKSKKELEKIRNSFQFPFLKCENQDFLEHQQNDERTYSLVIGNPPYIKKNYLRESQVELCEQIHKRYALTNNTVKNIWTAFLLRCTTYVADDGVLAFVLPAELLQVKFAEELRNFLVANFERTEVFTFDELLFDCEGQDTILLFCYKQSTQPGQFFTHIKRLEHLIARNFVLQRNIDLTVTNTKWTHHLLSADELNLLHKIRSSLKTIGDYCESKPGIVTAANSYFIVDEATELAFGLQEYTRPIIQKGIFVNGSVIFDKKDFNQLTSSGKPTKVLCFDGMDVDSLSEGAQTYLEMGEYIRLPKRYKCKIRETWFVIPNISTIPEGFFFKRSHHYPKLLKNNAQVLATDAAYKIEMKPGYKINELIYSFYNSLSLAFAELDGRYYGGTVLELTPNEFRNLPIPYAPINVKDFNAFTRRFENKKDIREVLTHSDPYILYGTLGLSGDDIKSIGGIYNKLIAKRFRKRSHDRE